MNTIHLTMLLAGLGLIYLALRGTDVAKKAAGEGSSSPAQSPAVQAKTPAGQDIATGPTGPARP